MRSKLRQEEGAAVAEFAVSAMLLIALAYYAIYAGEAFIVGLKAQEAEIAAAFDVSAYRLHDYRENDDASGPLYNAAMNAVEGRTEQRLRDLDSYQQKPRAALFVTQGETTPLQSVRCTRDPAGAPNEMPAGFRNFPGRNWVNDTDSYVRCQARARLENRALPSREGDKFEVIGRPNFVRSGFTLTMCGIGSTAQGCTGERGGGGMLLLTDDWALDDARSVLAYRENMANEAHPPFGNIGNEKYFRLGRAVFNASKTSAQDASWAIARTYLNQEVYDFVARDALPTDRIRTVGGVYQGDNSPEGDALFNSGYFKLAYYYDVAERREVPNHLREVRAHLTPIGGPSERYPRNTRVVYNDRIDNYLGLPANADKFGNKR